MFLSQAISKNFAKAATGVALIFPAPTATTSFTMAATGIAVIASAQNAQAEKVTITYPNGTTRELDTNILYRDPNFPGQTFITYETTVELDINHTGIGLKREQLTPVTDQKSKEERALQLSNNIYHFMVHLARLHKDGVVETANYEEKVFLADRIKKHKKQHGSDPDGATLAEMKKSSRDEVEQIYGKLYGPNWREDLKGQQSTLFQFVKKAKEIEAKNSNDSKPQSVPAPSR